MSQQGFDHQISAVRAFNRFYTRELGVLDQQLLKSPFSLSEARVLYELAQREDGSAKEIGIELGLDPGYLSRIIQNFDDNGLITRKPLPSDRRQYRLSLTAKGRQAFAKLDRSSHDDVGARLATLPPGDARRLVAAMAAIERLLGASGASPRSAVLRDPRPGDMGWVVQSLSVALNASEYGFDSSFEGLVADIAAKFLASFDASRERCWIADIDGAPVGSVFLVKHTDDVAKLRLLLSIRPGADTDWLGASDAVIVKASSVEVDERVRLKCTIPRCTRAGETPNCPPHAPDLDTVRKAIRRYSSAVLFKCDVTPHIGLCTGERYHEGGAAAHASFPQKGKRDRIRSGARHTRTDIISQWGWAEVHARTISARDRSASSSTADIHSRNGSRPAIEAMGIDVTKLINGAGWAALRSPR